MAFSRKTKYALVGLATFLVSGVIFGYMAIPSDRPNPLLRDQLVGPLDLNDIEAGKVLQIVVDSAPHALRIKICKDLARKRITVKTSQPETVGRVLGYVAVQLRTGIGDELNVHFRCRWLFDDAIVIEKRAP